MRYRCESTQLKVDWKINDDPRALLLGRLLSSAAFYAEHRRTDRDCRSRESADSEVTRITLAPGYMARRRLIRVPFALNNEKGLGRVVRLGVCCCDIRGISGTPVRVPMRTMLNTLFRSLAALAVLGVAHADEYTVKAGDILAIAVWKEPDLTSNTVLVRPDGTFSVPLLGQVDARGKGVLELQNFIAERLKKYIADPVVTVSVQEVKGNKVYVIGQVIKAGEFVVNPSVNVMQALSMAGGATAFASLNNIIILRRTAAGQVALPFHYNDVVHGKDLQQNVELQAGDVVVVP